MIETVLTCLGAHRLLKLPLNLRLFQSLPNLPDEVIGGPGHLLPNEADKAPLLS
jgi:hypothetical protein